jgi:hypothetical protein
MANRFVARQAKAAIDGARRPDKAFLKRDGQGISEVNWDFLSLSERDQNSELSRKLLIPRE